MPQRASKGQLEAAACEAVNRIIRERIGRGADTTSATFDRDLLTVHLRGVLTTIEATLVDRCDGGDGARSLVREMRSRLVETSRQELLTALASTCGRRAASMLHDLDVDSGDEVFVFRLVADDGRPARRA